jgi:2-hydroxy-4-carboxymuconate semialdehyde hemiacetal dehydrogenase
MRTPLSQELGFCIVGPGAIAGAHAKALRALGGCRFEWVVGRTAESSARFAGEWEFAHFTDDLEPPLADSAVDVVLITSPNDLHFPQATQALQSGKHVIVEIPAAMSQSDAEELERLSRHVHRHLLVCHTMRSYPAIREVRDRVRTGALTVSQVNGFFSIPRRENQNWTGGTRTWIDNLLWHHACHQVDASMWVLGLDEAEGVCGHFGNRHPTFGMTMDLSLTFRSARRQIVTHSLTYNAGNEIWELRFVTDEDLLTFKGGALLDSEGMEIAPAVDWSDLRPQNQDMLAAIRGESETDYQIASVLPAMRVLQQIELVSH